MIMLLYCKKILLLLYITFPIIMRSFVVLYINGWLPYLVRLSLKFNIKYRTGRASNCNLHALKIRNQQNNKQLAPIFEHL